MTEGCTAILFYSSINCSPWTLDSVLSHPFIHTGHIWRPIRDCSTMSLELVHSGGSCVLSYRWLQHSSTDVHIFPDVLWRCHCAYLWRCPKDVTEMSLRCHFCLCAEISSSLSGSYLVDNKTTRCAYLGIPVDVCSYPDVDVPLLCCDLTYLGNTWWKMSDSLTSVFSDTHEL